MSILVINHLSLDGVLQGPGRADEDTRDGFRHGGWVSAGADDQEIAQAIGEAMPETFSWLFGRISYEGMLEHWNAVGGPFKDGLNETTKHVATTDAGYAAAWPHTEVLTGGSPGDVVAAVADLRERVGDLVVMGSGALVRSLLPHGLVDEMLLMVHPVVLGSGRRLFGDGDEPIGMDLVDARPTASGVVLTTYRPQR